MTDRDPAAGAAALDETLLGRAPLAFRPEAIAGRLEGRVVVVTGAGGSIGAALCEAIAPQSLRRLVLLGRQAAPLEATRRAVGTIRPDLETVIVAADIGDVAAMAAMFEAQRPDIVFHAAANKHLSRTEEAPGEAVLVNVFATRLLAELAERGGAEAFVLVSSDRAIRPTGLLGASKRLAELVIEGTAARSATRFVIVRLGNVLGSNGSVLSIFKRQIAEGGPITLTHPNSQRYFLTLREATELLLSGMAMGGNGDLFMGDMGDPVRIQDLARQLAERQGLTLGRDIALDIVGLRPGEKILEEKLSAAGDLSPTSHPQLFKVHPLPPEPAWLEAALDRLETLARLDDADAVRAWVFEMLETAERSASSGPHAP